MSPPPLFCLPVFANSSTCMWLKIPGIIESSHMRKEKKHNAILPGAGTRDPTHDKAMREKT